ncbi:hypothetical protein B0H14DRAFT_3736387 [Mycena olivaceomarginata]|nr:hypothetical protein B0H14DRAFT_3736387 [Mycena olivaceomarginata]
MRGPFAASPVVAAMGMPVHRPFRNKCGTFNTTMMLFFYSVPCLKDFKGVQNSGRGGLDVELIGITETSELARFPYFAKADALPNVLYGSSGLDVFRPPFRTFTGRLYALLQVLTFDRFTTQHLWELATRTASSRGFGSNLSLVRAFGYRQSEVELQPAHCGKHPAREQFFALLLFATALAIYLWTIHQAIAGIVLGLTVLGFIFYTVMVLSAVAWEDSPFQTSLSFVVKILLKRVPLPESLQDSPFQTSLLFVVKILLKRVPLPESLQFGTRSQDVMDTLRSICTQTLSAFASLMKAMKPLLPLFHGVEARKPAPLFNLPLPPSKEVSAVIWAMETSTDPVMVHSAAAMVPELQWWPVTFDIQPSLKRLADTFQSCINDTVVREGMGDRATACVKAFGVLEMVTDRHEALSHLWTFNGLAPTADNELRSLVTCMRIDDSLWPPFFKPQITQWTLRFIATQQLYERHLPIVLSFSPDYDSLEVDFGSLYADFLFCLNSVFSPTMARDRSTLDKSYYISLLTTLLFENLAKRHEAPWNHRIVDDVDDILTKVAQFVEMLPFCINFGKDLRCRNAAYRLCATRCLTLTGITSVLRLVGAPDSAYLHSKPETYDVEWIYRTLESLHNAHHLSHDLIAHLLQILSVCHSIHGKPSADSLRLILSSFPVSSASSPHPTRNLIKKFALRVFCRADHWFSDDELGPILAEESVWPSFAQDDLYYASLGEKLSNTPRWKSIISQDLPGWLVQSFLSRSEQREQRNEGEEKEQMENQRKNFLTVLSRVWDADEAEAAQFGNEKTHVMMFTALANAWDRIDFSNPQVHHNGWIVKLLECTVSTAFSARIDVLFWQTSVVRRHQVEHQVEHPSQKFKDTIMVRLGDAVARAGERVKQEIGRNPVEQDSESGVINGVAEFLARFALFIHGELRNLQQLEGSGSDEYEHWDGLQHTWLAEVSALHQSFEAVSPSSAEEGSSFEEGSSEEGSSCEEGSSSEGDST